MINIKLKNSLVAIALITGTMALSACAGGYYWTDGRYGANTSDFYYVGSGYNGWDRTNYYDYGWGKYKYNRSGWNYYYPAYYYRTGYAVDF